MEGEQKKYSLFFIIIALIAGIGIIYLFISDTPSTEDGLNTQSNSEEEIDPGREPYSQGILDTELDYSQEDFMEEARSLDDAPYESSGRDPEEGFNSAGLVQYIYEEATGIRMPLLAPHQHDLGEEVGQGYLQTGDVLFFEGEIMLSGIYLENGEFITASESEGVSIFNLEEENFWSENYVGAQRLEQHEIESLHPGSYSDHEHAAVRESMNYLGTPYEFGGNSLEAFDCSYFIQEVYREYEDVYLPRVTLDQVEMGEEIPIEEMEPGDAIFFSDVDAAEDVREDGEVTHVGIYLGNDFMIHASRTEDMTQISLLNDYWTDHFTTVKRYNDMTVEESTPALEEAGNYLNVPFSSDGNSPDEGFSTTGFVQYVFQQSHDVNFPDDGEQLWEEGTEVAREDLQPEDIVFFEGNYDLLPGIYADNGLFFIASQSNGVTIRHLDNSEYFSPLYKGARRF